VTNGSNLDIILIRFLAFFICALSILVIFISALHPKPGSEIEDVVVGAEC
jgi:hypothetical protein